MALSPEVPIGYSIISMRMEPIKAFHVCHTIEFCRYRKAMVNLCQEAAFHSVPGAAPSACRRDSHLYAFKFPYKCTKCTTRNTAPTAASSTFRLHSPIAT